MHIAKTRHFLTALVGLVAVLCTLNTFAQKKSPNTIRYDSTAGSPPATLESLKWLAGHWRGEAFGGITEEVWTPAIGGSMMCAFKLVADGKVTFYELVSIIEEGGTLIMKLRHFHNDLRGWEEKDNPLTFRLVKVTADRVYFDEFTYERAGDNDLNIYVVIKQRDGSESEVKFAYKRFRPAG